MWDLASSALVRMLQSKFWPQKRIPYPNLPVVWYIAWYFCFELGQTGFKIYLFIFILNCARARGLQTLGCKMLRNFLFDHVLMQFQIIYWCKTSENVKKFVFLNKKRAHAHLFRSIWNCILQLQYILLSSHAKKQRPATMLSYV